MSLPQLEDNLIKHLLDETRPRSPSSPPLSICKLIPRDRLVHCQFIQYANKNWRAFYANSDDEWDVYEDKPKPKPKRIAEILNETKSSNDRLVHCWHDVIEWSNANQKYFCSDCKKMWLIKDLDKQRENKCNHDSEGGSDENDDGTTTTFHCAKCGEDWEHI